LTTAERTGFMVAYYLQPGTFNNHEREGGPHGRGCEYSYWGQAGQGMQSISLIMEKIFTRPGYYVVINQDVESRLRGGHNHRTFKSQDKMKE
jgi:hypothetical protein